MAYNLTKSATLNGSSQWLSAADSASLEVTGDLTIEGWFKPSANLGNGILGIFAAKYVSSGPSRSYLWYAFGNGSGGYAFELNISANGSTFVTVEVAGLTLTVGTWYHLAMVYTAAAGSCKFYINGSQVGTTQTGLPTSIHVSGSGFSLGGGSDGGGDYMAAGQWSLWRVWNTALSEATIAANICNVYGTTTTNMQAEWSLDNVLTDASGNTNTLTNNGTVTFATDVPATCVTVISSIRDARELTLLGVG